MAERGREERASRVAKASPAYATVASELGARVRSLRQRRHWTLEQAAEKMFLDLKHLQKIEAGTLNVTLVTLVRIAEGFGQPVRSLFSFPRRSAPIAVGHSKREPR